MYLVITQFPVLIAHSYIPRWSEHAGNTNSLVQYSVWRGKWLGEVQPLVRSSNEQESCMGRHSKM